MYSVTNVTNRHAFAAFTRESLALLFQGCMILHFPHSRVLSAEQGLSCPILEQVEALQGLSKLICL